MKTVQDYLDLGLVFVDGDKICGVTGDASSSEMDIFDRTICPRRYSKGAAKIGVDYYARARWTPSSFAWRNNDGVKPEYKGVIEFVLNGGQKCTDYVSEITWIRGLSYSVAKWRPVVLQSDDAKGNKDSSFKLPIGIDSPELRDAFKSLKDHLENKSPFWNKSIKTLNCPCVAVNIKAVKPAVPPKEDKPMKPVYTAEMHAKGELPPVGAECDICYENNGLFFKGSVIAYFEDLLWLDLGGKNPVRMAREVKFKPIQKTIKVNGFDVPAPMSEAPMIDGGYFTPQTGYEVFYCENKWRSDVYDHRFLSRGLVHLTKSAAIAHAKAMLGIDPNA